MRTKSSFASLATNSAHTAWLVHPSHSKPPAPDIGAGNRIFDGVLFATPHFTTTNGHFLRVAQHRAWNRFSQIFPTGKKKALTVSRKALISLPNIGGWYRVRTCDPCRVKELFVADQLQIYSKCGTNRQTDSRPV